MDEARLKKDTEESRSLISIIFEGFARMKHGRKEGLKLSLLDFFLCFRVFFLVFLDPLLRFRV